MPPGSGEDSKSLFASSSRLAFDPAVAVRHLRQADRRLSKLIEYVGSFHLKVATMGSPMEALAEAITHQQLHRSAATAIFARVKRLSGTKRFPTPEKILGTPDALFRSAGLSRAKTAALKDLAAKTIDGIVPTRAALMRMDDQAIVDRLTQIRGIGRWTAEMLLIFRLGRPDVLPSDDYGVRKGFALVFGGGTVTPADVEARGKRWRPYRTVASWYLWRALELPADSFPLRGRDRSAGAPRRPEAA